MEEMMTGIPPEALPVNKERLSVFMEALQKYKAGKARTEARIIASENWWKGRNAMEEQKDVASAAGTGFKSQSAWIHNVVANKHADAVEAYPEANLLPREIDDRAEAVLLSAIVPCILEQNRFEQVYSKSAWQKTKSGTGVYKVVWDQAKLNGLGDISLECCNLLNLYWEPGVEDIQKSRYFFHTELWDKDLLEQTYPQLKGNLKNDAFTSSKFLYDDAVSTDGKHTVIDVYYKKVVKGKRTLQYCKFVGDQILFATENEITPAKDPTTGQVSPAMAERGLYDHGLYPYVFDPLFPIEGSPCGYGYVDKCRNPQTAIDLLMSAFVENAAQGAKPRYFTRRDGNVNKDQFLDTRESLIEVAGNVDEASIRRIDHASLDGMYVNVYDRLVQELRETSGNTETATGSTSAGVTAASAIAALQEASGKTSKAATKSAYSAFSQVVELVIELIRQFYSASRQFRVVGQYGMERYIRYTNKGLQMQQQLGPNGEDMGMRKPVFDIKIAPAKKSSYTRMAQNELALELFKLGFFNPDMATPAMTCLEIMDFDGKDEIRQKVSQNGTIMQKLQQYMQLAFALCNQYRPELAQGIGQDIAQITGTEPQAAAEDTKLVQTDPVTGGEKKEHGVVRNARERSERAAQPT